ncbi:M56 family metallopeptidase [Fimbriimonas ginsengisoli]|uniref:TonB family protein n=1 Tax=Fimbriimonas ginsengisoli Gsoil 348 TaxID=661478 RepID=A0A068NP99_FIMGI|nr:M56 family metallopeptidase [Fimbriimonas ginsengisoli]AIE85388.1 TonB family protein [Fimbriimonas ginsengisoli Gsoil 348]
MNAILLDLVVKSVAVSLCGLLAAAFLRNGSAAARHLVLVLTLAGLLALPIASALLPRWQVPFVRIEVAAPPVESSSAVRSSVAQAPAPDVPPLAIAWGLVAGALALRVMLSLARLRRMESRLSMAGHPALQSAVTEHCRRSGRHVLLLEGKPSEPPMMWGHFRPVLLLPSDAADWPTERLCSVVLHELAHVERGDWLASMTAQLTCALYWFNPLVWVVARQIAKESENAADDRVLGGGLPATQYASHLLEVLRDLRRSQPAADAALAMARPGVLDGRLRAILEERRCRRPVRGAAALGMVSVLSGIVVAIGAAGPTIVRQVANGSGPSVAVEVQPPSAVVTHSAGNGSRSASGSSIVNAPEPRTRKPNRLVSHRPKPVQVARRKPVTPAANTLAVSNGKHSIILSGEPENLDVKIDDLVGIATKAGNQEAAKGMEEARREMKNGFEEARKEVATQTPDAASRKFAESTIKAVEKSVSASLDSVKKGLLGGKVPKVKPLRIPKQDRKDPPSG